MEARNRLWTTVQLADFLSIPVPTLYQWRLRGYGPRGVKVGKYLRYRQRDVDAWLDQQY